MSSIASLEKDIARLEKKRADIEREMEKVSLDMKAINNKRRTRMLIMAGEVIEEAGLLDRYDRDKLLRLLKMNYMGVSR